MQTPETAMFHLHLVLAYAFTWIIQLGYLGYVVAKQLRMRLGDNAEDERR